MRTFGRFDHPDILLVYHNAPLVDAQGHTFGKLNEWAGTDDEETRRMMASPWRFPQGFFMTFRQRLLDVSSLRERSKDYLGGSDPLAHDQWIYLMAAVFGRVRFVLECLVDYRQHGGNTFGVNRSVRSRWDFRVMFEKFCDYDRYAQPSMILARLLRDARDLLDDPAWRAAAAGAAASFGDLALLANRRHAVYAARSL